MEEYNRLISSRVLGNVESMIDNVPQPTMFGGKRQRDFVLPASTEYDYPASLAVGHLRTTGMPQTLGGTFWNDFGETEFLDEDDDQYQLEGGAFNLGKALKSVGKALKPVAPVAKELGMTLAKEGAKEGIKALASGGRRKKSVLRSVGKALKSVGREVAPVAKELFSDVIVPEGKKALRDYIRESMKPSSPPEHPEGGGGEGQSGTDIIRAMVGKNYQPFILGRVNNPSADLKKRYGNRPPAKKAKKAPKTFDIIPAKKAKKAPKTFDIIPAKKAKKAPKTFDIIPAKKAKKAPKTFDIIPVKKSRKPKGGVLIRDVPSQFHSSVYPPALASYTAGRDAFGRGYDGGAFNLGKALKSVGKSVAPVAKEVGMSLAKEGIKQGVKSYAKGGARASTRGAIVKEIMRKHGLSLPEASKFVKENNLY